MVEKHVPETFAKYCTVTNVVEYLLSEILFLTMEVPSKLEFLNLNNLEPPQVIVDLVVYLLSKT